MMNQTEDRSGCTLAEGFSVWEKLWAQSSFLIMGIVGAIGIIRADWPWVLPYIVICWYGIPGAIMRHTNCPRCPHLHVYGDCLQAPPAFTKWLVKKRKTEPFSPGERLLFYLIFLLIPVYPLYWLISQPVLLTIFILSAGMWYFGQWLYFCKRCRIESCPFNRAKISSASS